MARKPKQISFFVEAPKAHGGASAIGREKKARPVVTKRPMHLIVRSSRARGEWSFLRKNHRDRIAAHLEKTARRFGIRVHQFVNVGNHLHLLVQTKRRDDFQNFLRVFTQGVVFLVTRARKGKPVGKFWDALAFSRIVEWGRDWKNLNEYFRKNYFEAKGTPRDVVDWWFGQMPS